MAEDITQRVFELRDEGFGERKIASELGITRYQVRRILTQPHASTTQPPMAPIKPTTSTSQPPGLTPIQERFKELQKEGVHKKEIARMLMDEGYDTRSIMEQGISGKWLSQKLKGVDDQDIQAIIAGKSGRGLGYLAEWKELVRRQMSRSRQLTEVFYDLGLTVLLASLSKSGISIEEFRKIFSEEAGLRQALGNAAQTAFKALEFYDVDAMSKLERERDDARSYGALLESRIDSLSVSLKEAFDPKLRLEKMIYNLVLLSGTAQVDPNTLSTLIDKWLTIEVALPQITEVISK